MTMERYKEPKHSDEEISAIGLLRVSNSFRLQVELDALSLRIAKGQTSNMNPPNFKAVMLSSLRSLAKEWGPQHKVAWSCSREPIAPMLRAVPGKRAVQVKTLAALIGSLGEAVTQTARCEVFRG